MGQRLGSLIGAVGGLVFVLANAGGLGEPAALVLRVLGVVAFVAALGYAVLRRRPATAEEPPSRQALRTYGLCVVAMVVAIPLGAQLLTRVLDQPRLVLPWVVAVVGLHFVPFARAFGVPLFRTLGFVLVAVAVLGAVVTLAVDPRGAAGAGVAAGFVLLAFAFWGAVSRRTPQWS